MSGAASLTPRPLSALAALSAKPDAALDALPSAVSTGATLAATTKSSTLDLRRAYSATPLCEFPSPKKGSPFVPGVYPPRGGKAPRKRHQKRYKMRARQTIINNKVRKAQMAAAMKKRDEGRIARWRQAGALLKAREEAMELARDAAADR